MRSDGGQNRMTTAFQRMKPTPSDAATAVTTHHPTRHASLSLHRRPRNRGNILQNPRMSLFTSEPPSLSKAQLSELIKVSLWER
jgi:hypothetical protein